MRLVVISLLVLGVVSQRLQSINGIEAIDLFKPPRNAPDPTSDWLGPLEPSDATPQSHRTIYLPFSAPATPTTATNLPATDLTNSIQVQFVAPLAAGTTVTILVTAPNLETDPHGCDTTATVRGDCRCDATTFDPTYATVHNQNYFHTISAVAGGQQTFTFPIPTWTYFEHAPFPFQNPFLRTYRRLCLQVAGGNFIDTTLYIAITKRCSAGASCTAANGALFFANRGDIGLAAPTLALTTTQLNQLNIPVTWECNVGDMLGSWANIQKAAGATTMTAFTAAITPLIPEPGWCWGETREMYLARQKRQTCCGAKGASRFAFLSAASGTERLGTCFDNTIDSCCGYKPFKPHTEKCCSRIYARVNYMEQACRCDNSNPNLADTSLTGEALSCKYQGANPGTDTRGEDWTSPADLCCVNTKYPEFLNLPNVAAVQTGFCYLPTGWTKCCNTGQLYDEAVEQCCPVNGVQAASKPCPCNLDADCPTSGNRTQRCCTQRFPFSAPVGQGLYAYALENINQCGAYANYPSGTAPAEVQRCFGNCYSVKFQTCCNGQICVRDYDRCCNSTCCNRFTSGCIEGTRAGTLGFGGRINPMDFKTPYEICSSIEVFTTRRAFWVFVMPIFWLIATITSLAIVTVVARRATEHSFQLTERAMVFFSVVIIFLSIPHYFSPSYKYGVVAVFVGLFAIVAATVRSRRISLVTVFLVLGLLIYWMDPFNGNIYLSLTGGQAPQANPRAYPASGIHEFLFNLQRNNKADCIAFYDFFQFDPLAHDFERLYNPAKNTFGYCTNAWLSALLIFSMAVLASILILLLLAIFSYVKKLIPKTPKDDLAFEVIPEPLPDAVHFQ